MEKHINNLKNLYKFIEVGSIGESVLGKKLYYIRLGKGPNKVLYNGSHHGIEWITTPVLMRFMDEFLENYSNKYPMKGYDLNEVWTNSSIYIVPMVNPDGVNLVLNGLNKGNPYYEQLIKWNNGSKDFSKTWKANIRGVDLNRNYPALWEKSKEKEKSTGVYGPGPARYSGKYPLSEPESRALVNFTRKVNPNLTLAYHSQGRVIYWNFQNLASERDKVIGQALAKESSYYLDIASGSAYYGGYKDWFIFEFRRPGYTIEVGKGKNPLPISQFNTIYNNNVSILLLSSVITR
ncbi:hypothetical protein CCE28_08020 [Anaeromicrobium sediminis]|uniref:Peptidase M14 domain-containing protein n=2 Tax=Anaeromicrobium sediminis TaxID=1478221 RepID=A0A267MKP7_9FIRM|nr:hypothetical protein CCE28_08020 [Anaeromicrobium sediminis]